MTTTIPRGQGAGRGGGWTGAAYATDEERETRRRTGPVSAAVPQDPWSRADTSDDILTEAWRSGVAEPVAIHVRPEVHARLRAQAGLSRPPAALDADPVRRAGIPFVIDEQIPIAPGYEIHRIPPHAA